MADLVRVDELLEGDTIHFRVGGAALVESVKHRIGSGIGHQVDVVTCYGSLRYSCTGKHEGSNALDVIGIDVSKENQDKHEFDEAFRYVFGYEEKDDVLRGKCRSLYFMAKRLIGN